MQLSIVVPVYNVEKYISKCIESIVAQTNKNFELILVDDGSTDNSGSVCDQYARKYDFIRVYHIQNRGIGGARNYGVKHAEGEYILFVDADDYIANKTVDVFYKLEEQKKTDIVVMAELEVAENEEPTTETSCASQILKNIQEYTREQAIELLGYVDKILNSSCGKIINKEILCAIPFTEKVIYEDYETTYQMLNLANRIIYIPSSMYYYVQRNGSIMHSKWNSQRERVITISKAFMKFVLENYPDIYPAAVHRYFFSLNEMCVFAMPEKNYIELTRDARMYARHIKHVLISDNKVKACKKIRYMIMVYFPRTYRCLWRIGKSIRSRYE